MFKKIYWTCRPLHLDSSLDLWKISLNGWYTTKFFNEWQYKDFEDCNIVKMDSPIDDNRFTWVLPVIDDNENVIWSKPKLTRFITMRYSDIYTNADDLTTSIQNSGALTNTEIFDTPADAITWIKANTNLVLKEWTDNEFIISEEYFDEMIWETVPAVYLVID